MKRILTIQDISCFGKCSVTIALPVISSMGVEAVILPTAVFSTHTLFPDYLKIDLSDHMLSFARQWKKNNVSFDMIYTGYLGSCDEIDMAMEVIDMFKNDSTLVFTDPAMGDNGRLYRGIEDGYVSRNRKLCSRADIIVPNITEACMLTDTEYRENADEAFLEEICRKLCGQGSGTAVITGASLSEGMTGIYGMHSDGTVFSYQNEKIKASYHGTGDLFASAAAGAMVKGISMYDSFRIASDYTAETIRATMKDPDHPWYGVGFETTLPLLREMMEK